MAYGTSFLTRIKINALRRFPLKEVEIDLPTGQAGLNRGGYPQPQELASTIPLVVSELKAAKAEMTLSIPKKWVVIKKVELPVTVKENLRGVISFEMDRLTPFSSEEALYDFRILKEDEKTITILLAAVRADSINKYLEPLREKGIYISRVCVNLSGIGSLSLYMDRNRDSIFMEIDENEYEGALFTDGSISEVFVGSFPQGNNSLKIETILKEIAPLTESAKKERRKPQLLVSLKNIDPSFGEMLKKKAALPLRIFSETDIKISIPQVQKHLPYAAIGGVLEELWQKTKGFNLLTKGIYERQETPLFLTTILLLIMAALGAVYTIMPLKIEEKRLANIDSEIVLKKADARKFELLTREIKDIHQEISDLRSFKEDRPMTLDILKELTTILPENTWLTKMHILETTVEIEGYAGSATGLLQKLEASKYLEKVELSSPAFKDIQKGVDRFRIRMELEGEKKMDTILKGS